MANKTGAKAGKSTVSQADFIKAVFVAAAAGEGYKSVAAALDLGEQSVAIRYKNYVKAGIPMPVLVAGQKGRKVDVEAANKLIAELAKSAKKAKKDKTAEPVAPPAETSDATPPTEGQDANPAS